MGIPLGKDSEPNQYTDLELVNTEIVDALGKFEVYEDKKNGKVYLVFQSSYSITNVEMTESSVTQLKKIESIHSCCSLISYTVSKSNVLCFDNFSINLCFEYYNSNMQSEIEKKVVGTQIHESEIWGIIEDLVNYLVELKHFELHHGDLQPKHILFNKNRVVKVLCPLIYTTFENAYKLKLANNSYKSIYSPEELALYENRVHNADLNLSKCDIFALGLCILCYTRSLNYERFYDFGWKKIEMDLLKKESAKILQENKLSEELFFFVNVCTKQDPTERADFELLLKIISKKRQKSKSDDKIYW